MACTCWSKLSLEYYLSTKNGMMFSSYFAMTIMIAASLVETEDIPRSVSEIKAELGDKVTLDFIAMKEDDKFDLYKQSHGYVPQTVARRVFGKTSIYPPFNLTFTVEEGVSDFKMIIQSVTKGDEANYFCRQQFSDSWTSGIFLSVKDPNITTFDEKKNETELYYLAILVHRILLACCLLVIIILILIIHYRTGKLVP